MAEIKQRDPVFSDPVWTKEQYDQICSNPEFAHQPECQLKEQIMKQPCANEEDVISLEPTKSIPWQRKVEWYVKTDGYYKEPRQAKFPRLKLCVDGKAMFEAMQHGQYKNPFTNELMTQNQIDSIDHTRNFLSYGWKTHYAPQYTSRVLVSADDDCKQSMIEMCEEFLTPLEYSVEAILVRKNSVVAKEYNITYGTVDDQLVRSSMLQAPIYDTSVIVMPVVTDYGSDLVWEQRLVVQARTKIGDVLLAIANFYEILLTEQEKQFLLDKVKDTDQALTKLLQSSLDEKTPLTRGQILFDTYLMAYDGMEYIGQLIKKTGLKFLRQNKLLLVQPGGTTAIMANSQSNIDFINNGLGVRHIKWKPVGSTTF